jgi:hypothetical protein
MDQHTKAAQPSVDANIAQLIVSCLENAPSLLGRHGAMGSRAEHPADAVAIVGRAPPRGL